MNDVLLSLSAVNAICVATAKLGDWLNRYNMMLVKISIKASSQWKSRCDRLTRVCHDPRRNSLRHVVSVFAVSQKTECLPYFCYAETDFVPS